MHKLTPIALLFATAAAQALQPADVQVTTDPAVTLKIERRLGNTSKQILLTVNKQDKVTQIKIAPPAPAPVPAPPPAPAPAPVPPPPVPTDTTPSDMSGSMPAIDMAKVSSARAVGSGVFAVQPTTEIAPASNDGAFRTTCGVAFTAKIDPIVFPGKLNQSHLHTFFGNVAVNESSTTESLLAGGNSTCRGGTANRSAYWVPTMIDTATGAPVLPDDIGVYYKAGFVPGNKLTQGIPEGLRMIAGSPTKSTPYESGKDTFSFRYKCLGGPNNSNDQYGSAIPNCDAGAQIWQEIFFPQCWDGKNLDSPDHKAHMSYTTLVPDPTSTKGWFMQVCPATHPVILPAITFNVIYTVPKTGAALKWRLASDAYPTDKPGGYSAHGDWFNGWKHDISEAWFKNCLVAMKDCHSHLLGDGRMIY
jgi:hypothetical protein